MLTVPVMSYFGSVAWFRLRQRSLRRPFGEVRVGSLLVFDFSKTKAHESRWDFCFKFEQVSEEVGR